MQFPDWKLYPASVDARNDYSLPFVFQHDQQNAANAVSCLAISRHIAQACKALQLPQLSTSPILLKLVCLLMPVLPEANGGRVALAFSRGLQLSPYVLCPAVSNPR